VDSALTLMHETVDRDHVSALTSQYGGKVMCVHSPLYPHCEIYLCGTQHVANTSIKMVLDVVHSVRPNYVIVELCGERLNTLHPEQEAPEIDTVLKVVTLSWKQKSLRTFFAELFALMQNRGAQLLGGRVGGELSAAARAGHEVGSTVILGDRAYSVTMQRIDDRLTFRGKIAVAVMLLWETLSMSVIQMTDYTTSADSDLDFVQKETDHFAKHLPVLADVVITERDAYLARTIADVASLGFGVLPPPGTVLPHRGRIVAVVGAGHLVGIRRHLMYGGASSAQMHALASSSAHNSTWAGPGMLHVVDVAKLYAGL